MKNRKQNIVALTVSVNFHDELRQVLQANHKHFIKWYIATEQSDTTTIDICKPYENVEVVFTDITLDKRKNYVECEDTLSIKPYFNKGGALKTLQLIAHKKHHRHLKLILDSDIILPQDFCEQLSRCKLHKVDTLYGAKRRIENQYNKAYNEMSFANGDYPFGFFHLYYCNTHYYEDSVSAARCDEEFVDLFKTTQILPINVDHIGEQYVNWYGRTDKEYLEARKNIFINLLKKRHKKNLTKQNLLNRIQTIKHEYNSKQKELEKQYKLYVNDARKQTNKEIARSYYFYNENQKNTIQQFKDEKQQSLLQFKKLKHQINTEQAQATRKTKIAFEKELKRKHTLELKQINTKHKIELRALIKEQEKEMKQTTKKLQHQKNNNTKTLKQIERKFKTEQTHIQKQIDFYQSKWNNIIKTIKLKEFDRQVNKEKHKLKTKIKQLLKVRDRITSNILKKINEL